MKSIRFCIAIGLIALCTGCGLMDSGTSTSSNNGNGSGGGSTNTPPPPPPPPGTGSVDQIKHVVWMLQENRSFDHYFGKLNDYRQSKGLGADVDGLPADASNPSVDNTTTVNAFHLSTVCFENVTPSWDESRRDINRFNPDSKTGPMNGFVYSAGRYAQAESAAGRNYTDLTGTRAMGYYTERELPYYYFMATQFATSDRFFSPILSRTPPNRIANLAASALGVVNNIPVGTTFSQPTIFTLLQNAGKSWRFIRLRVTPI